MENTQENEVAVVEPVQFVKFYEGDQAPHGDVIINVPRREDLTDEQIDNLLWNAAKDAVSYGGSDLYKKSKGLKELTYTDPEKKSFGKLRFENTRYTTDGKTISFNPDYKIGTKISKEAQAAADKAAALVQRKADCAAAVKTQLAAVSAVCPDGLSDDQIASLKEAVEKSWGF